MLRSIVPEPESRAIRARNRVPALETGPTPEETALSIAAEIVAESVSEEALAAGTLFPRLTELREITFRIACAVAREANALGFGSGIPDDEIEARVSQTMWDPKYPKIEAV